MISKILALVLGVVICVVYGVNIQTRKTIVLNSSRMKKLNNNIIQVDNRCFRIDKKTDKCEKQI